jgi:Domain of Unknown Function (DUF349)
MGLLDRFRSQPAWKHPDAGVRLAAVDALPLDDQDLLAAIAAEDGDPRVRRAAVGKLMQPAALGGVASGDGDERVRDAARAMLRDLASGAFEDTKDADCLAAVEALAALADPRELAAGAKDAPAEAIARAALDRLSDAKAVTGVARQAQLESIRLAALARVTDAADLLAIALRSEHRDVALAALDRIEDREALDAIANRARTKAVARRARTLVRGLDDATAADVAEPVAEPEGVGRRQQLDLCRSVEALLHSEDWAALDERLLGAQAQWSALVPDVDEDLADRFEAACTAVRERIDRRRGEEAAAARRHAATAARIALCERIDAIDGPQAREELDAARAEWEALPPMEGAGDADAVVRERFEEACRVCLERHETWEARQTQVQHVRALADEFEQAIEAPDTAEVTRRWTALRQEWIPVRESALAGAELVERMARLEARVEERDAQLRAAREQEERENLQKAQQHCEQLEQAAQAPTLTLKQAERRLRDAKTSAGTLGRFPTRHDRDEIAHRLRAIQATLFQRVQELREIDSWQRWANASVQEELCAKMEALAGHENLEEAARELRNLQERWKKVSAAPREKAQELWGRFRAAQEALRARLNVYFAEQAAQRAENLKQKEGLCEQAEALADSTDWIRTADALKQLQARWKEIGAVPRGNEKAVWERFRTACDRFFTRRHADLAQRKEMWSGNLARKEALCAQVEALADAHGDWEQTLSEIKRLQAEWKTVGPVRKNKSDAIWQRFRAACDRCFQERAERGRQDLQERLATRESMCAALEALAPAAEGEPAAAPDDLVEQVRGLRQRWQQAGTGGLPREQATALAQRFTQAFHAVVQAWPDRFNGTDLDLQANRRRMEELCVKVERLVSSSGPRDAIAAPATRLAEMLREALAANTIGGRVDDDARWRAAAEEIKRAQAAWLRIGPVPDEAQRALAGRFQRACRRFFDQRDQQKRKMSSVS